MVVAANVPVNEFDQAGKDPAVENAKISQLHVKFNSEVNDQKQRASHVIQLKIEQISAEIAENREQLVRVEAAQKVGVEEIEVYRAKEVEACRAQIAALNEQIAIAEQRAADKIEAAKNINSSEVRSLKRMIAAGEASLAELRGVYADEPE